MIVNCITAQYFGTIACVLGTGILGLPITLYHSDFYPFFVVSITAFVIETLVILIGVDILQKTHAIQVRYDKMDLLSLNEMRNEDTCDELKDQPENEDFVTIASILGTGILGLPMTLNNSGFYPFLVLSIIVFLMETLLILIGVEILQKAHAIQVECNKTEMLPLKMFDEIDNQLENNGHNITTEQKDIRSPDLHLLGEMFLGYGIGHVFDIIIVFETGSLLIGYSLAGSGAYSKILGIEYIYVIPVFNWSLTFFIVFAFKLIRPVVSVLTFITASLFTMVVIMTFLVIMDVQENIQNNFNYIQDSFLMSTIALGGSFFVMPYLFKKIENDASQIKKYRIAVVLGLVTCTVLNILWCWAVVEIVPQHCTPMVGTNQSSIPPVICNSLESAKENGEISTVPLIKIIRHKYPSFFWVSTVVEVFIVINLTVSYLTVGTALHHTICGIVESNLPKCFLSKYKEESKKSVDISIKCGPSFLSLILFGIIFIIAMLNPKGFLDVIEKFASSVKNSENLLVAMMFIATKKKDINKLKIPLPLSNRVMPFIFLLPLFFGFAIGYDIYFSIMSSLYHETDKSHLPELQLHLHQNSTLLNVTKPPHINATS